MANGWTPEWARQAEQIRLRRPWEQSTGPRSFEGKAAALGNAWQGEIRAFMRDLARGLREQNNVRLEVFE